MGGITQVQLQYLLLALTLFPSMSPTTSTPTNHLSVAPTTIPTQNPTLHPLTEQEIQNTVSLTTTILTNEVKMNEDVSESMDLLMIISVVTAFICVCCIICVFVYWKRRKEAMEKSVELERMMTPQYEQQNNINHLSSPSSSPEHNVQSEDIEPDILETTMNDNMINLELEGDGNDIITAGQINDVLPFGNAKLERIISLEAECLFIDTSEKENNAKVTPKGTLEEDDEYHTTNGDMTDMGDV